MKNIITALSLLLFSCSVYAQKYELNLNPVFVDGYGTYVNASVRKAVKKHVHHMGVSFLINPPQYARAYDAVYVNKAFANNFFQHFFIGWGYERSFIFRNGQVRIFPFTEIYLGLTGLKNEVYVYDYDNLVTDNGIMVYPYNFVDPGDKVYWLINHTGVGCELQVTKKIRLSQKIGLSPAFVYTNSTYNYYYFDWESGITTPFFFH